MHPLTKPHSVPQLVKASLTVISRLSARLTSHSKPNFIVLSTSDHGHIWRTGAQELVKGTISDYHCMFAGQQSLGQTDCVAFWELQFIYTKSLPTHAHPNWDAHVNLLPRLLYFHVQYTLEMHILFSIHSIFSLRTLF